jgi:hypothetical protein
MSNANLQEDGLSEEFFNLLWSRDELNFNPLINIPDTVFFKYGQPTQWYFTATNGKLKRKNRQNLMVGRIEEVFLKHVLGYEVVATFINIPTADIDTGHGNKTTMEFLDRESFNNFLYKDKKEVNGVLQRFIEPKGTKNETVRAIWSPKVCLLERAENIHQLHDHRFGLYERCVTYEGPEYYAVSAPLRGPVLAGQLQKTCESIVSHISEVSFGQIQISRVVINFKIDSREKIWLLYTTSIRTIDLDAPTGPVGTKVEKSLLNIESVICLPTTINLNPQKSYEKIVNKNRIKCISCASETLATVRHPISYKSVIKHYEHVLHLISEVNGNGGKTVLSWPPDLEVIEAAGGVGFGCLKMVSDDDALARTSKLEFSKPLDANDLCIPPILRYLHPKLSAKSYIRCRIDPIFLYKTVTVCESCYLVYAEFTTMLLRLGQDLTSLLKPDPSHQSSTRSQVSSLARPSEADWKAMSHSQIKSEGNHSHNHSGSTNFNRHHRDAKDSAIGIRSSDIRRQPDIPRVVRKFEDAEPLKMQYSVDSFITAPQLTQMSLGRSMSMGGLPSQSTNSFEDDGTHNMIQEREQNFFKEVARNPQLKDQHPLIHLISAQQKLKMADEQSGVLKNSSSAKQEGLFGSKYGKTKEDKHNKYGAYQEDIPYRINGKIMLPSAFNKMKDEEKEQRRIIRENRKERIRRVKSMKLDANTDGEVDESIQSTTSAQHASFLRDTLMKIEGEVEKSTPFAGTTTAGNLGSTREALKVPYEGPGSMKNRQNSTPNNSTIKSSITSSAQGMRPLGSAALGATGGRATTSHQGSRPTSQAVLGDKNRQIDTPDNALLASWGRGLENDDDSHSGMKSLQTYTSDDSKLRVNLSTHSESKFPDNQPPINSNIMNNLGDFNSLQSESTMGLNDSSDALMLALDNNKDEFAITPLPSSFTELS